jgi:hypothetical protein
MTTIEDIRNRLAKFAHDAQWHGAERALLGAVVNGVPTVPATGKPGWVNVRILRTSGVSVTVALNTKVQEVYGLEVWVGENAEGELSVLDLVESNAAVNSGTKAPYLRYPVSIISGLVKSRRFQPGLVITHKISGSYTMVLKIHPFAYYRDGVMGYFYGDTVDMTSSIPATANTHRLSLIGLDPDSNSIAIVDGMEYPLSSTLTISNSTDINPGNLIPLASVRLYNGMSSIDSGKYIFDLRPFVSGASITKISSTFDSQIDLPVANGQIMYYDGLYGKWRAINPGFEPSLPPVSPNALDDEFSDESLTGWRDITNYWSSHGTPDSSWEERSDNILHVEFNSDVATQAILDFRSKIFPAGDFTIITKVRLDKDLIPDGSLVSHTYGAGLFAYRNVSGSLPNVVIAGIVIDASQSSGIGVATTQSTSLSDIQNIVNRSANYTKNTWIYLRLRKSSSNYDFDYSYDGINWVNGYSGTWTSQPTEVGICVFYDGAQGPSTINAEFEFFRFKATYDNLSDPAYGNRTLLTVADYDPDMDLSVEQADNADTVDSKHATDLVQKTDYSSSNSILVADSPNTPTLEVASDNTVLGKLGSNPVGFLGKSSIFELLGAYGTKVKNSSGGAVVSGTPGYIDFDGTFKTSTTDGLIANWCIVLVGGDNNADIYVTRQGRVTVILNANCSVGDYLKLSTTAGQAGILTYVAPEIFAVALTANSGGAGGTCEALLLCNSTYFPLPIANLYSQLSPTIGPSDFVAQINGTPSGTTVVYKNISSGDENLLTGGSVGQLVLHNTTRGDSAIISSVNVGTNTITLTANAPAGWANNDAITIRSQLVTGTSGGAYFMDLVLSSAIPALAYSLDVFANAFSDSGGAGAMVQAHAWNLDNPNVRQTLVTTVNAQTDSGSPFRVMIVNRRVCLMIRATGAGTAQANIRLCGVEVKSP